VADVQRRVDKRAKRSAFSRYILAKGDKDQIIAWRQDLVRILHVFNVRSIGSVGNPRTYQPIQTELAIDTNIRVADTQTMVADARMTVTNTQTVVADTQTMVADIHRNMLAGQKDDSGRNQSVGATCYS
jgi:hypothetical protein